MNAHVEKVLSAVESDDATSAIEASWRRCSRMHRLVPQRVATPERDSAALRDALDREHELLAVARDYLDRLHAMLASPSAGAFLADRTGLMLDLRTGRSHDVWHRKPESWLGTSYAEAHLGTNGIGTCLIEQRPTIMRGPDHFLARYTGLVCVAAPIFAPDGALAGCLCVNDEAARVDTNVDAFIEITVHTFARRIEIELFARAFPESRLVMASQAGNRPWALLAVDRDDGVVGATRAARELLDVTEPDGAGRTTFDQLLGGPEAAAGDLLARAERRVIERTLARAGGNLSAAAEELGIGRSTLYRKLKGY